MPDATDAYAVDTLDRYGVWRTRRLGGDEVDVFMQSCLSRPDYYEAVYVRGKDDPEIRNMNLVRPVFYSQFLASRLDQYAKDGCRVSQLILSGHTQNTECDYLDVEVDGSMGFLPRGKPMTGFLMNAARFNPRGRQSARVGRVVGKVIKPSDRVTDLEVEQFTNRLRSSGMTNETGIRIVSGDDIRLWYDGTYYADVSALQNSCMRYSECQGWLGLYEDNPDVVSMAILLNKYGHLAARALIWKTDGGFTFMDRIYGTDVSIQSFKTYAREQGWWHREHQSYSRPLNLVDPSGSPCRKTMMVTVGHVPTRWPYLDTFKYFYSNGRVLHNSEQMRMNFYLCNTSGRGSEVNTPLLPIPSLEVAAKIDANPKESCTLCGELTRTNDLTAIARNLYCPRCLMDHTVVCQWCGTRDQRYDMVVLGNGSAWCCRRCLDRQHLVLCTQCSHAIEPDDQWLSADSAYYCERCFARCVCSTCNRDHGLCSCPRRIRARRVGPPVDLMNGRITSAFSSGTTAIYDTVLSDVTAEEPETPTVVWGSSTGLTTQNMQATTFDTGRPTTITGMATTTNVTGNPFEYSMHIDERALLPNDGTVSDAPV